MARMQTLPLVAALVGLCACANVPTRPTVMALPGSGKSFGDFQNDDRNCRGWAAEQTGVSPAQAQSESTVNGAAIGTGVGAVAGTLIGVAAHDPGAGAAIGAGTGLLVGASAGASAGEQARYTLQSRYDMAYTQCMYANGEQVPVPGGAAASPPPRPATPATNIRSESRTRAPAW